jgi:hypothetical protein
VAPYKGNGRDYVIATYQVDVGKAVRAMVNPWQKAWGVATPGGQPFKPRGEWATVGEGFDGDMAELVVYTRVLSLSEINRVTCMLSAKWKTGDGHC